MKSIFQAFSLGLLASATAAFPGSTAAAINTASYCPPREASLEEQRAIFEQAVQTIIFDQKYTEGVPRHYDEGYIQHDPFLLSGRQNVLDYLADFDPESVKFTVINKGLDYNRAFIFQRVDFAQAGVEPLTWVDLWRFNGTCIMEHWGVNMPKPADAINPLPMW
ncbi:integron cassette protein [Colletotrichum karsti]|uniref:Integron cassette protein n=1 Tax=Colletotrichum karsti TaxID=1095194 RepID=A0A9P6IFD6_9PEZI|nr:integron cassette protein [Colletotrichum karsti]KAF9881424.1 integron cassette protein [Colletotrichum karsti]